MTGSEIISLHVEIGKALSVGGRRDFPSAKKQRTQIKIS